MQTKKKTCFSVVSEWKETLSKQKLPDHDAGPEFHDLAKSRSREIVRHDDYIALDFDRRLGSDAGEQPVKFQSDWKCLTPISRLPDFTRYFVKTSVHLVNRGSGPEFIRAKFGMHDVNNLK